MQRLKQSASRDELFEADEFSADWETQQAWRVQRTLERGSERLGVPIESMRLTFTLRHSMELMNRNGDFATYRPKGIITQVLPLYGGGIKFMEFETSWVDVWGYPHRTTKSFMEIVLGSTDELSFRRQLREIVQAQRKLKVEPLVQ